MCFSFCNNRVSPAVYLVTPVHPEPVHPESASGEEKDPRNVLDETAGAIDAFLLEGPILGEEMVRYEKLVQLNDDRMQAHIDLKQFASAESAGRLGIDFAKKITIWNQSIKNALLRIYTNLTIVYCKFGKTHELQKIQNEFQNHMIVANFHLIFELNEATANIPLKMQKEMALIEAEKIIPQ